MPPRPHPTARQVRLGAELRKMREAADATAREAAEILGSGSTQLSHIEAGRFGVSEDRIRRLSIYYACDDEAYVDALVAMAAERVKGWWEEYRGRVAPVALDLAELEHHAKRIRTFEVAHIPGLLQTEDHIHAAFRYASPNQPQENLDAHIAFRTDRQRLITESDGTPYEAVIHEAALRIRVGGRKATRAQLERILERSELDHVTVHVLPFDTDDFAGSGHSMLYAHGPVPQLDTVLLDTMRGSVFHDLEHDLMEYRRRYEQVAASALDPSDSRNVIRGIIQEL